MTTIKIQPNNMSGTHSLTHLPEQIGEMHGVTYYEGLKKKEKLEKYIPKSMPVAKPTITEIEAEIRELGDRYDNTQTASQILAERNLIWQELYAFFSRVEAEKEASKNRKFKEKYDATIADINDVINGENSVVDTSLQTAIQQIRLPFELTVNVDYDKIKGRASITAMMPLSYCIPTTKTVYHSRGWTEKNKLQRELQQEESECIIGLAMLLAGQTFTVSPNIKCVNTLFYKHHSKEALLAMHFDRTAFVANRSKMDVPSVALYEFPYAANIRTVREAMVLGSIPDKDLQIFFVTTNQIP